MVFCSCSFKIFKCGRSLELATKMLTQEKVKFILKSLQLGLSLLFDGGPFVKLHHHLFLAFFQHGIGMQDDLVCRFHLKFESLLKCIYELDLRDSNIVHSGCYSKLLSRLTTGLQNYRSIICLILANHPE